MIIVIEKPESNHVEIENVYCDALIPLNSIDFDAEMIIYLTRKIARNFPKETLWSYICAMVKKKKKLERPSLTRKNLGI